MARICLCVRCFHWNSWHSYRLAE